MKSKFTTSLALVAVLLTGTAAAAINTQALNGPTESTISTGATTLLPATESVAIIPGQAEISTVAPSQSAAGGQTQNQVTAAPTPSQTVVSPVTNQPSTSITSAPTKSSLVFATPNPSTGDDDEGHDNEEDDEDEDEDEDDD